MSSLALDICAVVFTFILVLTPIILGGFYFLKKDKKDGKE